MVEAYSDPAAPERKPGRIGKALIGLLMKRAAIAANTPLGERFRLVSLEGPALRSAQWVPGQKVQIAMDSAFVARTYTPMDWDADRGRMQFLGFAHGSAPGSHWLREAREGDECHLFGPRPSLDLRPFDGPIAFFGDETSLGLACAAARHDPRRIVSGYFEVDDETESTAVADQLSMGAVHIFQRSADDAHLADMEAALPALAGTGHAFVLTGKAGTVQWLRQALKQHGVPPGRIRTKAYWAPGKVGMD